MRGQSGIGFTRVAALAVALTFVAGTASAYQFTLPSGDTRLHTIGSGQPGAEWTTGGLGSNGDLSYDSGTEILDFDAELDVLNYFDPNVGSCPTDAGSNCTFNFSTNLELSVVASLAGISVNPLGGTFFELLVDFETTGGTDVTITDTTDNTVLLSAAWQAGTFLGSPTTGLSASVIYDSSGAGAVIGDLTLVGFLDVTAGDYAQLFESGTSRLAIAIGESFDFSPTLTALAGGIISSGSLGSFTAEGEGQLYRAEAGEFVPEPHVALLMGLGLLGGWTLRRRS